MILGKEASTEDLEEQGNMLFEQYQEQRKVLKDAEESVITKTTSKLEQ